MRSVSKERHVFYLVFFIKVYNYCYHNIGCDRITICVQVSSAGHQISEAGGFCV